MHPPSTIPSCPSCHGIDQALEELIGGSKRWFGCARCGTRYSTSTRRDPVTFEVKPERRCDPDRRRATRASSCVIDSPPVPSRTGPVEEHLDQGLPPQMPADDNETLSHDRGAYGMNDAPLDRAERVRRAQRNLAQIEEFRTLVGLLLKETAVLLESLDNAPEAAIPQAKEVGDDLVSTT
jgi:hypothetical protein